MSNQEKVTSELKHLYIRIKQTTMKSRPQNFLIYELKILQLGIKDIGN